MRKALAVLWLALLALAAAHLTWAARNGLPLESDLMALLPHEEHDPAARLAQQRMAATLSRRLVVLVGHPDRAVARAQAETLRDALAGTGLAHPGADLPDPQAAIRLGAAYFPHRAALLAEADRRRLLDGNGQALVTRALSQLYGFAGPADSRLLAHDPLLLFPAFLAGLPAPASRLSMDDGWPSVAEAGTTWVMVSMVLNGEPTALDTQDRVTAAYDRSVAAAPAGTRWLRLGALFYAQAGTAQGLRESARIGTVSVLGTVLLMLLTFRSPRPLALALTAVAAGLTAATAACLALFGSLHVAAQLFGATLIGVAVDYALHYFAQVFAPGVPPARRLERVKAGLALGAATTVAGYATLALSPFPGLRQVAVFSTVGLAAALATVMLWFPLLDRTPCRPLPPGLAAAAAVFYRLWDDVRLRGPRRAALAVLALAAAMGATRIEADDDMRRQQGLSPVLAAEQAEIQRLTGLGLTGRFFLVEGVDEQQVLEREEALARRLNGLAGWQAVSAFVPSARRQAENLELAARTLYGPHLAEYRARLGLDAAAPPAAPVPLAVADIRATGTLPVLDTLVLAPGLHAVVLDRIDDPAAIAAAAQGLDGIRLVDPTADLGALLRAYRLRALALLPLCLAAMAPLLAWRYGWSGAVRVAAPAVVAVAATPPLLALAGIGFSFFAAMALVLVLTIGTDYAVFCAEDAERDPVTLVAVSLAMATTVLSFGLLSASDLAGVRAFGATMLVGVVLAFALSPMARRGDDNPGVP